MYNTLLYYHIIFKTTSESIERTLDKILLKNHLKILKNVAVSPFFIKGVACPRGGGGALRPPQSFHVQMRIDVSYRRRTFNSENTFLEMGTFRTNISNMYCS